MIQAFIMVNVETGSEENVLKHLKTLDNIKEAYVSYGVYDLIVKVKADNMEDLKEAVTRKIRSINEVESTLTLVMTEEATNPE